MKIKIRAATSSDAKRVLFLLKELKTNAYKEMGLKNRKIKASYNALDFYRKIIKRPDIFCLLAQINEEICGLCFAFLIPKILEGNYRLIIEEMIVREKFRSKGIGIALLNAMEKKAKEKGVDLIKLTSGIKLKANKFYQKHGYVHFENAYRKKLQK